MYKEVTCWKTVETIAEYREGGERKFFEAAAAEEERKKLLDLFMLYHQKGKFIEAAKCKVQHFPCDTYWNYHVTLGTWYSIWITCIIYLPYSQFVYMPALNWKFISREPTDPVSHLFVVCRQELINWISNKYLNKFFSFLPYVKFICLPVAHIFLFLYRMFYCNPRNDLRLVLHFALLIEVEKTLLPMFTYLRQ